MAKRFTAKTVAAVSICALAMVTGCQASGGRSGPAAVLDSVALPAAVPPTTVLEAVQAAATLRDVPTTITMTSCWPPAAITPTSGRSRDASHRCRRPDSPISDRAPSGTPPANARW